MLRLVPFDSERVWHQFIYRRKNLRVLNLLFDPASVPEGERAMIMMNMSTGDPLDMMAEVFDDTVPAVHLSGEWCVEWPVAEATPLPTMLSEIRPARILGQTLI